MWMPLEEFLSGDHVHPFNKSVVRAALAGPGIVPGIIEGHGDPARFEFLLPKEALQKRHT